MPYRRIWSCSAPGPRPARPWAQDARWTPNRWGSALLLVLAWWVPGAVASSAQEIPRDEYLEHLPLSMPRLVPHTAASVALDLFGDPSAPGYRDEAPVDGIDDRRGEVLMALAVRFAPFLVTNTTDFPVDFARFMENRDTFPLTLDTWDTSEEDPRLVGSRAVNFSALGSSRCASSSGSALDRFPEPTVDPALEDCKMLELMDEFTPGTDRTQSADATLVRARPNLFEVLFFDFPGDGARNWKHSYRGEWERTPAALRDRFAHAFVHPFVRQLENEDDYEVILQYWFFYPTNDSGMDHEGDWEHVNVVVSPRSMVERGLTAETVRQILRGDLPATDGSADPLVIKRVDYYFHDSVMMADFSSPNVYLPREEWEREVRTQRQARLRERRMWRALRYMAYADDAETRVNTHAIGYIGADNKGLNQALEPPGGSNRDPHGTYPFPGRYANVGPGGTTDQVSQYVDSRQFLAALAAGTDGMGPDFEPGSVLGLADPQRLRLLPDWERVVELVRTDPVQRRAWGWFVLPIHWGYPATQSPFSGILENFNTGNVAPPGPSYNAGWNRSGPSSGFSLYEPHEIPDIFPLQVQDNFRNDLGFLNLTLPTLLNLPPLDFLTRIAAYPLRVLLGRRDPVYYPNRSVPSRFVGISSGISLQSFDDDFDAMALNEQHFDELIFSLVRHLAVNGATDATSPEGGDEFMDASVGTFVQVPFYLGEKFVSENTVRNSRARFGATLRFTDIPEYSYRAEISQWEYSGSLRYNVLTGRVKPFAKAGYGWSWLRLENVQTDGIPFTPATTDWTGPDNILPNVRHYGLGLEVVPWPRVGDALLTGLDVGLRVEFVRYSQALGLDLSHVPLERLQLLFPTLADVPSSERVNRNDFIIGVTLSF